MAFPIAAYRLIEEDINGAHSKGPLMVALLEDMATNWANSEIDDDDIEKTLVLNAILQANEDIDRKHVSRSSEILNFVFRLQEQAIVGYTDINDFLSSNNIKAGSSFAALSEEVNYTINAANIED
tara:strand:- start:23563 stop:23937 length:375 start_codon:yes stop_codon:yes gene_type:complete